MSQVQPAPVRPRTPGRLPPLTAAGARPRDEIQIKAPVVAGPAALLPLHPEPEHVIVDAEVPEKSTPQTRVLEELERRHRILCEQNEIFATWAALPIAAWGGLTLAGCVFHFHFFAATFMALITAGGCVLPFVRKHRFLRAGVGVSLLFSLSGGWLLGAVGGIFTAGASRVLAWWWAGSATEMGAPVTSAGAAAAANPTPTVDQFLAAVVIGAVLLLNLGSWIQAGRFVWLERRKQKLLAQIASAATTLVAARTGKHPAAPATSTTPV